MNMPTQTKSTTQRLGPKVKIALLVTALLLFLVIALGGGVFEVRTARDAFQGTSQTH